MVGPYIAAAGQTDFPADFPVINADGLRVRRERDGAVRILTPPDVVAITGDDQPGFIARLAAPSLEGDRLWVYSELPAARMRMHTPNGAVRSLTLEDDAEGFQAQLQEVRRDLRRALVTPLGDEALTFPDVKARKGRFLAFDETGAIRLDVAPEDFNVFNKADKDLSSLDHEIVEPSADDLLSGWREGDGQSRVAFGHLREWVTTFMPGERKRTLQSRAADTVHFMDEVPDEADRAAIRAGTSTKDWSDALDAALARCGGDNALRLGRVLILPSGKIRHSRPIMKPFGVIIEGGGMLQTELIHTTAAGNNVEIGAFDQGGGVRHLTLSRSVPPEAGVYELRVQHGTSRVMLEYIRIRRGGGGLRLGSTDIGYGRMIIIEDCAGDGVVQAPTRMTPADPYDPAVQWQLTNVLAQCNAGTGFNIIVPPGAPGAIVGRWHDCGTFGNSTGSVTVQGQPEPNAGIFDLHIDGGFFGSDGRGMYIDSYGRNIAIEPHVIERVGEDKTGPRWTPAGAAQAQANPTHLGHGIQFTPNNSLPIFRCRHLDGNAQAGGTSGCDIFVETVATNNGKRPPDGEAVPFGWYQGAGRMIGMLSGRNTDGDTSQVAPLYLSTDASHILHGELGGTIEVVPMLNSTILSPLNSRLGGDAWVGGALDTQDGLTIGGAPALIGFETGFTPMTGTARKTGFPTYGGATASAAYDPAQMQGVMNSLVALSELVKGVTDALLAHKGLSA